MTLLMLQFSQELSQLFIYLIDKINIDQQLYQQFLLRLTGLSILSYGYHIGFLLLL